jgi:hypothetical protein
MSKSLDLKITVAGEDPDATLRHIIQTSPRNNPALLTTVNKTMPLSVVKIERADGQPIGLEAEFEEYWQEYSQGRERENPYGYEKGSARDAFMYAVKLKSQQ